MDKNRKILFLGLGFELELILAHILQFLKVNPKNLYFTRRNDAKAKVQADKYGIGYDTDNRRAINSFKPDIVFVGVKPQDIPTVIADLNESEYKDYSEMIFITASLPFKLVCKIFPHTQITNIIPDAHIDAINPSNIINFCSNSSENLTIKTIFEPTCKKLIRVNPNEMNEFTALVCQGNPILNLFLLRYENQESKNESFSQYCVRGFSELVQYLANDDDGDKPSITKQLATGYKKALENISIDKNLAKEILILTFDSLSQLNEYFEQSTEDLQETIQNWATIGGYEEKGIEIVKKEFRKLLELNNFTSLPEKLIQEMHLRGESITKDLKNLIEKPSNND